MPDALLLYGHLAHRDGKVRHLARGKVRGAEAEDNLADLDRRRAFSSELGSAGSMRWWHGRFPYENLRPHGFVGTSPVRSFPPNGYGLYDVAGNVWEWTNSRWSDQPDEGAAPAACCAPRQEITEEERRITKGGSHLCAPSYCHRYRPAARQGHAVRSTTGHLGFRCVIRA